MTKPIFTGLGGSNQQGWDAPVHDALMGLYGGPTDGDQNPMPVPFKSQANGGLPAAASWPCCMCVTDDGPSDELQLYFSNGTDWILVTPPI